MATQGTEKVLGGTPYKRYPDPNVKGTPNQFGLYPWSAFDAPLTQGFSVDGIALPAANIGEGTDVPVLVFTSDIPAISRSLVTDSSAQLQYSRIAPNTLACPFVSATSGGPAGAGAGVTIAQYGQVLSGYTGGAYEVYVTGFPLLITITTPAASNVQSTVFLQVIANSPVINGVVGPLLGNSPSAPFGNSPSAPSPIILTAGSYTQAIKDNGNIYQFNATAPQYQVVGLWEI